MSLDTMMLALRESKEKPTRLEAGMCLAEGGWAVFPLRDGEKYNEQATGAVNHLKATRDPARFHEMATFVMEQTQTTDINIGLYPHGCAVPLLVIDLDGSESIRTFFDTAVGFGHVDVSMWLRVNSTRPDHGRHIYFTLPPDSPGYSNSQHVWGGDVRSARGYCVMPPSMHEGRFYTWSGEKLYQAPEWVLQYLNEAKFREGGNNYNAEEVGRMLDAMSRHMGTAYGDAALDNLLHEITYAVEGDIVNGRHPAMVKAVYRSLDLALDMHVNALDAINRIYEVYGNLFDGSERDKRHNEVIKNVQWWFNNRDGVTGDVTDLQGVREWVVAHGGDSLEPSNPVMAHAMRLVESTKQTHQKLVSRASISDHHKKVNK